MQQFRSGSLDPSTDKFVILRKLRSRRDAGIMG